MATSLSYLPSYKKQKLFNAFNGHCASQYEWEETPNRFSFLYQEESIRKTSTKPFLKLVAASLYLPKDDPRKPRGEDAHFVCVEENCIGVADGVGGWCKKGVDAGEYARELMANSVSAVHNEPKGLVNPKRVLQEAYSNTKGEGSCTACIITLNDNILRAANVGDSGFLLIRDGKVIYKSPVQQRYFNCPYQLGKSNEDPSVAEELQFMVRKGDIVVAGTDGLFDNMHVAEIEETMCKTSNSTDGIQVEHKACAIANLALYNSFDKYSDTPYSMAARKAGRNHVGGKIDDITVIVAYIEPSERT